MATRLTGAPVASKIYAQVREKAATLGTQPCLAAVSVGAQPDDRAYLRSIARSADGCGVAVRPVELPADCAVDALTGTLHALSADDTVHGVLLLRPLLKKSEKIPFWRLAVIELPSEVMMVLGYFGYKALILGKGLSAAASIPNNLVQAAIGIVLSVLLYTALSKVPEIHKAFWKGE